MSLPPGSAQLVAVDPTDHTIVYAAGQAGLNKSTDDARTWQVIFSASSRMPVVTCWIVGVNYLSASCDRSRAPINGVQVWPIDHLAISPADHNLL